MNCRINLLPWRDRHRVHQNRLFYGCCLLSVGCAIIIVGGFYQVFQFKIRQEALNIDFLKQENNKILEKIKQIETLEKDRSELLERFKMIQDLQKERFELVKFLDHLTHRVPAGICLTKLARRENKITLEGQAETNSGVSTFLKNLEDNATYFRFFKIKLKEIVADKDQNVLNFKMELGLKE